MKSRRGFTLIEIMVSFGVGLILLGVTVIISANFIKNRELVVVTEGLVSYLRSAEQRALASEGNMNHGVSVTGGQLTLFRGSSYAGRQTAYDSILPFQSYITITGITEVVFAKQTGAPSYAGTVTVGNGTRSASIIIYSTGAISQ